MSRVINVLTRTSARPNYFKRCRESILAQETNMEVRHIVSVDRPCDYAEADLIVPALGQISPEVPHVSRNHRPAPYNLYINDLLEAVEGGWVFILDDDDEFVSRDSLAKLESHLAEERLVVCRFLMGERPMPTYWAGPKLIRDDLPCSSIVYHSKHKKLARWHGKYSGDWHSANNLSRRIPLHWVNEIIAATQEGPSEGKLRDIEYRPWEPRVIERPGGDGPYTLSIIIPVFNECGYTEAVLENIAQTVTIPHEIIVIDNGSTDETVAICEKAGAEVIRNSSNLGVYKAWNQGARVAQGRQLYFLNNDLRLPDRWAETLMRHGAPFVCPSYSQGPRPPNNFISLNRVSSRRARKVVPAARPGLHPKGFAGFCFMLERDLYKSVGPFNDRDYRYWYGDNDYYNRVLEAGVTPVMSTNVSIHHFHSRTIVTVDDFEEQKEKERRRFEERWSDAG